MDPLFHLVLTFTGGFLLLKGLDVDFRAEVIFILSILSCMIDVDHFLNMKVHIFHNVFPTILLPFLLMMFFHLKGRKKGFYYMMAFMVMGTLNLLADMVNGCAVPLFYPLSNAEFMIPYNWVMYLPWRPSTQIISRMSIALSIYFGLIFSIILAGKYLRNRRS